VAACSQRTVLRSGVPLLEIFSSPHSETGQSTVTIYNVSALLQYLSSELLFRPTGLIRHGGARRHLTMSVDRRTLEATVPLPKKPMDVPRHCLFELRVANVHGKPDIVNRRVRSEPKALARKLAKGLGEGRSCDGYSSLVGLPHLADFHASRITVKRHVRIGIVQVRFRQFATSTSFCLPPNSCLG